MDNSSTVLSFDTSGCTGCAACAQVCPREAITFEPSYEGFLYPHVNQDLCISCGKCQKVCAANPKIVSGANEITEGYIALSSSYSMESRSSSGGIADALTRYVLSLGGWVVAGCVMEEDGRVCHRLVEDMADAWILQGSKYVQSDVTSGLLNECQVALQSGKKLLFFGTPCQIYGMRSALTAYGDNIIGVDLICHGVPSPLFWEKAFGELVNEGFVNNGKDLLFRHRSAWERDNFSFLNYKRKNKRNNERNAYYSTFLDSSSFRESCYSCKFANAMRPGDLTIGDCATLSNYMEFAPVESASSILVNSVKGGNLLQDALEKGALLVAPFDYEAEIRANAQLHRPSRRPIQRDRIYFDLLEMPYEQFEKKYQTGLSLKKKVKGLVKRFIPLSMRTRIRLLLQRRTK